MGVHTLGPVSTPQTYILNHSMYCHIYFILLAFIYLFIFLIFISIINLVFASHHLIIYGTFSYTFIFYSNGSERKYAKIVTPWEMHDSGFCPKVSSINSSKLLMENIAAFTCLLYSNCIYVFVIARMYCNLLLENKGLLTPKWLLWEL